MKSIPLFLLLLLTLPLSAKPEFYNLVSPNGRLVATVQVEQGGMSYAVEYDNRFLSPTTVIGLRYEQGGKVYDKMTVRKVSRKTIDETIASPFSRQATMRNHCNEMTLSLRKGLSVVFRAYDDGVAYRYVWEGKPGKVFSEVAQCYYNADTATVPYVSQFDSAAFGSDPFELSNVWTPQSEKWKWFYPQYRSSFENQYQTLPLRKMDSRRLCFLPLLLHGEEGMKICITESALLDYPGMYMRHFVDGILECQHAPLPRRVEQGGHNNLQLLVREREDYIAEMDESSNADLHNRLISIMGVNSLLKDSKKLRDRILFEHVPSGEKFLAPIIEALRDHYSIQITHQGFGKPRPYTFVVEPYCLKMFKQRWYMLARSPYDDEFRVYGLDRILALESTGQKYDLPDGPCAAERIFRQVYGVTMLEGETEEIIISISEDQAPYLRTLPIHPSQREIEPINGYPAFSFNVYPSAEFCQELFKYGSDLEVHEPKWLREDFAKDAAKTNNQYNH